MTRALVLSGVISAGVLVMGVAAFQQPAGTPAPMTVEVEKLRDNLYVLRGGGGNTAVFVQADGVTVVDTKNPGWGQPVLAKIKELTSKPVTTIINTHTHFDHVSGNVEFSPTVEVVTHENTATNMKTMSTPTGIASPTANVFEKSGGRGMPKRTFKDRLTLGSGNDRVELHYFGRGHTNGDAWVLFPSLRVLHAGDIFSGKNMPLLDYNNGGSGTEIGDTLMKAYQTTVQSVDSIITGHSAVMTPADLREYAEFNRDFLEAVRTAKRAGKTVDEIVKSWTVPEKYKGYAPAQPARLQASVEHLYNEIK